MITIDQLTEGQRNAFEHAKSLILKANELNGVHTAKVQHLTINGPAGTGKTTMMKFLVSWLTENGIPGVALAAPTHQAKKVLTNIVGEEASTIHSILKINPTTYEEKQFFEQKQAPDLSKIRVLICEEASMYDLKLFEILMNSVMPWTIIIGIGDDAQLRPSDGTKSRFFTDVRFKQVHLTEIKRSNAPIIEVATDIRNGKWISENVIDGQGVFKSESIKTFMASYFDVVKSPDDLFETRMFAYTNDSVDTLNSIIRKRLYSTEEPFIEGEIVVMQEPLINEITFEGKRYQEIIFNNGELIEIKSIKKHSKQLKCQNVDFVRSINFHIIQATSVDTGETAYINVIDNKQELNSFYMFLGKVADIYKSGQVKAHWKDFWAIKNMFHKIKALPASTIHKGQGCTINNSFMYTPCILKYAETDLAQELMYVGVTRARNNVYYV